MSIDSLTGDEFMSLCPEDHRVALSQYEAAIDTATVHLAGSGPTDTKLYGPERSQLLDRLTSLLTLRKLHKVRLEEMEEDAPPTRMQMGSAASSNPFPLPTPTL